MADLYLTSILRKLLGRFRELRRTREQRYFEKEVPSLLDKRWAIIQSQLERSPSVLVVKQDINEDLYCCPPEANHLELIKSTLLRTGPVALFTELNADFRIVETVDDPECQVWKERATILKWASLDFFPAIVI